jgi:hypothetical protein
MLSYQNACRESLHVERGGREGPNVSHLTLPMTALKGPSAFSGDCRAKADARLLLLK